MISHFMPTRTQLDICQKYQSKVIPYAHNEMIAVALASLGKQPIVGERIYPRCDETISWFFHCGEYSSETDFYQPIHIGHLKQWLPEVEDYLCLDYGYKIIIDGKGYQDVWLE